MKKKDRNLFLKVLSEFIPGLMIQGANMSDNFRIWTYNRFKPLLIYRNRCVDYQELSNV